MSLALEVLGYDMKLEGGSTRMAGRKRVVITGIGMISPAGIGKSSYWSLLMSGKTCINRLTRFDPPGNGSSSRLAAEVHDFNINQFTNNKIRKFMDRSGAYAVAAAVDCLRDAEFGQGHPEYELLDLYMGSCCGAVEWAEKEFRKVGSSSVKELHPHASVVAYPGNVIGLVTIVLGIRGRGILFSNLDSSGVDALGSGIRVIQSGRSNRVLVGATEAPITPVIWELFDKAGLLSHQNSKPTEASRPFDRQRDGFVMGEGSVMLLLEELEHALKRGAEPYAELLAYAATWDGYCNSESCAPKHICQGQHAIEMALQQAGVGPETVDYICADACSLPHHDRREAAIIKQTFGKRSRSIPVSSIKSSVGHLLGAAGLLQSATCAMVCREGFLPPMVNYQYPDPECDLNFLTGCARAAAPRIILQNTYSVFQQRNAAVLFAPLTQRSAS